MLLKYMQQINRRYTSLLNRERSDLFKKERKKRKKIKKNASPRILRVTCKSFTIELSRYGNLHYSHIACLYLNFAEKPKGVIANCSRNYSRCGHANL